jgi:hypothetical protein
MSRASTPSAFSVSMTFCCWAAVLLMASAAVGACELTPSVMVAMSGWATA